MDGWFDSSQWAHLAELSLVTEMDAEVQDLAERLRLVVQGLSLYGRPPLVAESCVTIGPLECRWWIRMSPPGMWHCAYQAREHLLHNTSGQDLRRLIRSLARARGLQNPIAFAATLQCLTELRLEVSSLPSLADEALRSIPGWLESAQIVESFMVAHALAEGQRRATICSEDSEGDYRRKGMDELGDQFNDRSDEEDEFEDIPF